MLVVDDRFDSVSNTPFFGSAPTALLNGFRLLGVDKIKVHVICCVKSEMPAPSQLADNIFYHQIVLPHWTYLRSLHAGPVLGVRKLLSQIRPDLVHSHGVERWCAIAGSLCGFPAVLTIHGHLRLILQKARMRPFFYWHLQMLLGEWAMRRHRGVICISSHIQKSLRGKVRQTWLIPNAIRDEFINTPASRPRTGCRIPCILVIGTITENKRPLELLKMFADLNSKGAKFTVRFIGKLNKTDKYGAAFVSKIQERKIRLFAEHLDPIDSTALIAEMDNADALVHFPLEEAFGLVVAEALSRELKVFASEVGGIIDICRSIPGAELVPPADFRSLSETLYNWLASGHPKSPRSALIARSRYCTNDIAAKTLDAYHQTLDLN